MRDGTHGIYRIICGPTGEAYIGKSTSLVRRLRQHFRDLARGIHANHRLQAAFSRFGQSAFDVLILAEYTGTTPDNLDGWERFYIEHERPELNLKQLRQR